MAPFGPLEASVVSWERRTRIDDVVAMAGSRGYLITAEPDERSRVLTEVRRLASTVVEDDGLVRLPYVTHAYRATVG